MKRNLLILLIALISLLNSCTNTSSLTLHIDRKWNKLEGEDDTVGWEILANKR